MSNIEKAQRKDRFKIPASVRAWHVSARMRRTQKTDTGEAPPEIMLLTPDQVSTGLSTMWDSLPDVYLWPHLIYAYSV
ncbi:MAG: hypothetical protein GY711_31315 [bacterium]|nr:hypothetical protein [bacterium]